MDSNNAAQTATGVTTVSGITTAAAKASESYVGWVNENAVIIGISCTAISLVIALIFHVLNYRSKKQLGKNSNKLKRAELISRWLDEGKTMEEINEIFDMAETK